MEKKLDTFIYLTDKSGGGRLYLKRDWLIMLDVDPTSRAKVPVSLIINSDKRELLIKKKLMK